MSKSIFDNILKTFENKDIKEYAKKCIETIPEYFYEVPASSTGKYHPDYACTVPLGLAKHTVALVKFLNHMFGIESISNMFSSRERDLLRLAGIMHDSRKSGGQEDYKKNKYTNFDHPLQAAEVVRHVEGLPESEIEYICHVIESHMGQWNTDKRNPGVVLPKPTDNAQIILHLADYLASRKDIEVKFDNIANEEKTLPTNPEDFVMPFGKHKGMKLGDMIEEDQDYMVWCCGNLSDGIAKTLMTEMLQKNGII